jgi:hypothetical protein
MPCSAMFVTVGDDLWTLPGVRAVSALVLASGEMAGAWGGGAAAGIGVSAGELDASALAGTGPGAPGQQSALQKFLARGSPGTV